MSNWISVDDKDNLPEDEGPWPVAVYFVKCDIFQGALATYYNRPDEWVIASDRDSDQWPEHKITHWLNWWPLPELPPVA